MQFKFTWKKIAGIVLLVIILAGVLYAWSIIRLYDPPGSKNWGVTFSHTHAQYLGFDWRTMYLDILNDLQPKNIRLMTYWEDIEAERGKYNFSNPAEMILEAQKRGINVVLVVGHKQPRWPECHHPAWYNDLPQEEKDAAQLEMVRNAVNYYKQFSAIKVWQVENEPMFGFGPKCEQTSADLIAKEMAIVKELDDRPILLTDSGELGKWVPVNKLNPDIFGSTMYRVVENPKTGYFKYPLGPWFFHFKAGLVKKYTQTENIIGVELQAEPWFTSTDVFLTDLNTQKALMNPKIFKEYIKYAEDVGFEDNYLWGVEWWYWMAKAKNDWGMWNEAKQVLSARN